MHEDVQIDIKSRISFKSIDHLKQQYQSSLSFKELEEAIVEQNEDALLEIFKHNKSLDLIFVKLPLQTETEIYTIVPEQSDYITYDQLNLVQLITILDLSDTCLGYFLKSHEINVNSSGVKKNLPGSALVLNRFEGSFQQQTSLILRILISWGRISTINSILEGYPGIWTSQNIKTAAQVLIAREEFDYLERLLDMTVTFDILLNAPQKSRNEFIELLKELENTDNNYIYQQFKQAGYLEKLEINIYDVELQIQRAKLANEVYEAIKINDHQKLKQLISTLKGHGDVGFDSIKDEFPFPQIYEAIIESNQMNMIVLSIYYENYECLVEILNQFPHCTREALFGNQYKGSNILISMSEEILEFSSIGLAILSVRKNIQILKLLLEQDGFILSPTDFRSLVICFEQNNFKQGIQAFMSNFQMQAIFASMDYQTQQKRFITEFLTNSSYDINLILKRPYLKIAFIRVLEEQVLYKEDIQLRIAKESLKKLTKDDFQMLLYYDRELVMTKLDSFNHQNQEIENEVKRVLMRIKREVIDIN